MKETPTPSPAPPRRPKALISAAAVLGAILVLSLIWRVTVRERAAGPAAPQRTALPDVESAQPMAAAQPSVAAEMPPPAAMPEQPSKAQPNAPVDWNGDYRRFFPLAPGNTWKFQGRNTRGPEDFEYIWHISRRIDRPGGGTLYVVDLYRNGAYRDQFLFGGDENGTYRYSTPDGPPGVVILYPALAGTKWPAGSHEIRILGTADITTPAGRFPNAVQVCTQERGKPGDAFWTAGYEYFVPGVGRVESVTFSHRDGKTDTLRAQLAGYTVQSD